MKLAPFFAISAALHAVAFFCPVSFIPRTHEPLIPVTVISLDEPLGGSGGSATTQTGPGSKGGMNGGGKKKLASLSYRTPNRLAQAQEQTPGADAYPHRSDLELRVAKPREPKKFSLSAENVLASGEVGITAGSATLASLVSLDDSVLGGTAMGGGQSQGTGGTGQLGSGSGVGRGDGSSARNTHFTQVRYRETPKPPYPESARREGKEGRVLLRVLVDQEGRSKSVEVSGGSGSETLDRAAAEAIKLWRFSPARYGDKPVESWVRIPVDFRLTDVGDQ